MSDFIQALQHCLTYQPGTVPPEEAEQLRRKCRRLADGVDPEDCYFEVKLGPAPEIGWQHRTEDHLDRWAHRLSLNRYCQLPHKGWHTWYFDQFFFSFRCLLQDSHRDYDNLVRQGADGRAEHLPRRAAYLRVPLLSYDGKYHWYRHKISVGCRDEHGKITSLLNEFRYLAPYANYLPVAPVLTINGRRAGKANAMLHLINRKATIRWVAGLLTPGQISLLDRYRKSLPAASSAQAHRALRKDLDLKPDAYKKAWDRLRARLRKRLACPALANEHDLSCWLNKITS